MFQSSIDSYFLVFFYINQKKAYTSLDFYDTI